MAENIWAVRERRKRELKNLIASHRATLQELEHELSAIEEFERTSPTPLPALGDMGAITDPMTRTIDLGSTATPTIKEMVRSALDAHSPKGASSQEIRQYIAQIFGNAVQADSLRSQLARMKADGLVEGSADEWKLTSQPFDRQLLTILRAKPGPISIQEIGSKLRDNYQSGVPDSVVLSTLDHMEKFGFVTSKGQGWSITKVGAEKLETDFF